MERGAAEMMSLTTGRMALQADERVLRVVRERSGGQDGRVNELEEGTRLTLDFDKLAGVAATGARVVPVVLQDASSGDVLFIGYANDQALKATLEERIAVLWSTSRNELWRKGATSGDVLELVDVRVNCEQNSLLYLMNRTTGGACHTTLPTGEARPTCYYRSITGPDTLTHVLD